MEASSPSTEPVARRRNSILANRGFRWLISGSFISMLGDQFTLIALPWLVLKLTGNAVALGTVLAVMAIPRAALMLVGGAYVDRLSPIRVLLVARSVNAVLIGVLATLVWTGQIQLWMLYLLALALGTATAFVYPAGSAVLPQIVKVEHLAAANSFAMGLRQLSMFIGPALAGAVIALFSGRSTAANVTDAKGIAIAFTIDAVSFLASLGTLFALRNRVTDSRKPGQATRTILHAIAEGFRALWRDVPLRAFMLYFSAVSILVGGPLQVGLPVLADNRLDWGAGAFGILMAANGGGVLVGSVAAGAGLTRLIRRLGLAVLTFDSIVGLVVAALGLVHVTALGAALIFVTGTMGGFLQVAVFTWMQRRVPQEMMGRMMSILMFTFLGLAPLAAAAGGFVLAHIGVTGLFVSCGLLLTTIAVSSMFLPGIRSISAAPAEQ